MRVQLIGQSSGAGVSRDVELLGGALRACGCDVSVTTVDSGAPHGGSFLAPMGSTWRRMSRGRARVPSGAPPYDLNVMLEHVWPQFFDQARRTVAVPNPEWFDGRDLRVLARLDRVWAKTTSTERIFAHQGARVVQTGFDSEDRSGPAVARERIFFHLAGNSPMKGTSRLVDLWRRHPEWPLLIVVAHLVDGTPAPSSSANVEVRSTFVDDGELRHLQNRCLFHLCPSEAEGWGHYIVEAMSVGAITITVDAPPMNEIVTPARGLIVAYNHVEHQKLGKRYFFDERALETAVTTALAMPPAEIAARGAAARQWFLANKAGFVDRVTRALRDIAA